MVPGSRPAPVAQGFGCNPDPRRAPSASRPHPLPSSPPMASSCSTPDAMQFLPTTMEEVRARG